MDCEHLIDLVRNNPHLYDKGKKGSGDKDLIADTWLTISQMLEGNYTAVECERKWKLLRERYTREHRMYVTIKENYEEGVQQTGMEPPQEPHWEYYHALKFLDQHIKHKNRLTLGHGTHIGKSEEMDVRFLEFVDTPLSATPSPNDPASPQFLSSNKNKRRKQQPYCDPLESVKCELTFSPPSPVPSTSSSCSSRKKKKEDDASELKSEMRRCDDGDDLFGRLVAAELKKIANDNDKRAKKRDILNILYT